MYSSFLEKGMLEAVVFFISQIPFSLGDALKELVKVQKLNLKLLDHHGHIQSNEHLSNLYYSINRSVLTSLR
jgi:hypothetical protein